MPPFGVGDDVDGAEFKEFSDAWAWFPVESDWWLAVFGCEACSEASGAAFIVFEVVGELTGVATGLEIGVEVGIGFLVDTGVEFWVITGVEAP